jgi:CBS domain-containing protein
MLISHVLQAKGHDVVTILTVDIVGAVVRKLAERQIGAAVVVDRWQKVEGIFSERDVVKFVALHGADGLGREVREMMNRVVVTCAPSDRVDDVMAKMTAKRIRHLPVMDGQRLVGIVSLGDLVHFSLSEKTLEAEVLRDMARVRV